MNNKKEEEREAMFYIMGFLTETQWAQAIDEFKGTHGETVVIRQRMLTYNRYSISLDD